MLDDAEVMRDEQVGEIELFLKVLQKIQDLRLHRHIQGGDCFIGDDEPGVEGEGARNANALPFAPAEGMRIAPDVFRPQADPSQQRGHPVFKFGTAGDAIHLQRLAYDLQNRQARIQGGERVLKYHADLAPEGPQFPVVQFRQVNALLRLRLVNDLTGAGFVDTRDAAAGCCFAAAGFTDKAQGFPRLNAEADIGHGR